MNRHHTTVEEYSQVMKLSSEGMRICEIVKLTNLKRSCINNWIHREQGISYKRVLNGLTARVNGKLDKNYDPISYLRSLNNNVTTDEIFDAYSYIFGLYLGDGCIYDRGRVKQLMFALDNKYPELNQYTIDKLITLFNKKPQIYDRSKSKHKSNCSVFSIYSVNLGLLFPQDAAGHKHSRKIKLIQWQTEILNPKEFIKGLIMSDGCYFYDNNNKKYMYDFTNTSKDIISIYCEYLDILNIKYSVSFKKRRAENHKDLQVVRVHNREEVLKLYEIIGDKYFNTDNFPLINYKVSNKNKIKITKPRIRKFEVTKESLEQLIKENPMTEIGKMFGVSDNAIKKRCKKLGIELKPMRGYWRKVETGKI